MDAMQIMRAVAEIKELDAIVAGEFAMRDAMWESVDYADLTNPLEEQYDAIEQASAEMMKRVCAVHLKRCELVIALDTAGGLEGTGVDFFDYQAGKMGVA